MYVYLDINCRSVLSQDWGIKSGKEYDCLIPVARVRGRISG